MRETATREPCELAGGASDTYALRDFSVIIPVWHESERINALVEHVRAVAAGMDVEIIVSDGAPQADTLAALRGADVIAVRSQQGRAVQMNAGAHAASGDVLVFLHADTTLPHGAFAAMRDGLEGLAGTGGAGAFQLGIEGAAGFLYAVQRMANWRNRLTRTPYGDQVQFFRKRYFHMLGGYSDLPIMEDVDIMRRVRQRGDRIALLSLQVQTSARRWYSEGMVFCSLRNLCLRTLYALGVSAQTLSRWYLAHKRKS